MKDPKKQQDNRSEWEKTWIPTQIPDVKEEEDPIEVVGSYSYEDEEPSCVLMWCKSCKVEYTQSMGHDCKDFKPEEEPKRELE